MAQPYVDGITDTVAHSIASSLTAGQIAAHEDTVSVSVVCPDRWFLGDFAVVTSRDGRALAAAETAEADSWGFLATSAPRARSQGSRSSCIPIMWARCSSRACLDYPSRNWTPKPPLG